MSIHCLSIAEFLRTTKFSETELFDLLGRGELSFIRGEHGELLIDVSEIDLKQLARTALVEREQRINNEVQLEQIASSLVSSLDSIVEEALEMALRWLSSDREPEKQKKEKSE